MSEMEEKLGAILSNPQMMQQIMSMAQAMSQSSPEPKREEPPPQQPKSALPGDLDLGVLQKVANLTRQNGVDPNQQSLLRALSPYLSRDRVTKLEKAMRAAKIARAASMFLNSGGLQMLSGR